LSVVRMRDVIPRMGLPPLFSLFACRLAAELAPCVIDEPLIVRNEDGQLSAVMQQVRRGFGFAT
jgi:tRNA1(Val) A37 N6-methylase TrmN6